MSKPPSKEWLETVRTYHSHMIPGPGIMPSCTYQEHVGLLFAKIDALAQRSADQQKVIAQLQSEVREVCDVLCAVTDERDAIRAQTWRRAWDVVGEYNAAQRDGLDAHGAYDCMIEKLQAAEQKETGDGSNTNL